MTRYSIAAFAPNNGSRSEWRACADNPLDALRDPDIPQNPGTHAFVIATDTQAPGAHFEKSVGGWALVREGSFNASAQVVAEHKLWLGQHCKTKLRHFGSRANADYEAASAEAWTSRLLRIQRPDVIPGDDPPDFVCGERGFVVETTNLLTSAVTDKGKLPEHFEGAKHYAMIPIEDRLVGKLKSKARALGAANLQAPSLVVLTIHHRFASLMGVDELGILRLMHSRNQCLFMNVSNAGITWARRNISAILLLDLSRSDSPVSLGALHPNPVREFRPEWLPELLFCGFEKIPSEGGDQSMVWHRRGETRSRPF